MNPSISIAECCKILRDNQIPKTNTVLSAQIQAGLFPEWSVPSAGSKEPVRIFQGQDL